MPRFFFYLHFTHYSDVIMSATASQIPRVSIVCSPVCSGTDQRKHQRSTSLAFVRGIHPWPVDSSYKGPVTQKMFPFDDVILKYSDDNYILCHARFKKSKTDCCHSLSDKTHFGVTGNAMDENLIQSIACYIFMYITTSMGVDHIFWKLREI